MDSLTRFFGKIVAFADKATVEKQYSLGATMIAKGYHHKLSDINAAIEFCKKHGADVAEVAYEIANISKAVCDAEAGVPNGYLAKIDTKQSGISIQSMITRDKVAMQTLGLLDDTNSDLYMMFVKAFGNKIDRKTMKKAVIPRFYGSTAAVCAIVGAENLAKFCDMYAELLPKCDQLRQAMLDAWDDKATEYAWTLPDHAEVVTPVQELFVRKEYDEDGFITNDDHSETQMIEWVNSKGVRKHCYVYYPKKGALEKGEDGTRALGANVIHSLDAYLMRELITRCANAVKYSLKFESLKHSKKLDSVAGLEHIKANELMQCWKDTGIVSLRVMDHLRHGDVLPDDYYYAIKEAVNHLPEHHFDVVAVHDEFMCHINYVDEMQKAFNYLMVELYKGHFLEYIAKMLNWEAKGLKIEIDSVNPEIVEAIANSTYLLQ